MLYLLKTIPEPRQNLNDCDGEKLEQAFDELISNIEYGNNLINFEGVNKILIQKCKITINLLEKILIILDEKIKN